MWYYNSTQIRYNQTCWRWNGYNGCLGGGQDSQPQEDGWQKKKKRQGKSSQEQVTVPSKAQIEQALGYQGYQSEKKQVVITQESKYDMERLHREDEELIGLIVNVVTKRMLGLSPSKRGA